MAGPHDLTLAADDAPVSARQGTALALCVQELYSNAIKHGQGNVFVALAVTEGQATLQVDDNGAGFPPGFDPQAAANIGLELVLNLVRTDLSGTIAFGCCDSSGGRVTVAIPLSTPN